MKGFLEDYRYISSQRANRCSRDRLLNFIPTVVIYLQVCLFLSSADFQILSTGNSSRWMPVLSIISIDHFSGILCSLRHLKEIPPELISITWLIPLAKMVTTSLNSCRWCFLLSCIFTVVFIYKLKADFARNYDYLAKTTPLTICTKEPEE